MLPLSRRYTHSPYLNFEKNVYNPFFGDFVGPSINLLQFIVNIHSKGGRFFTLNCFWYCKRTGNAFKRLDFSFFHFFGKTFALFFRATSSSLSSFISLYCMFLSNYLSWSAIVFGVLPCFSCGTRNCILFQWAQVELYTSSLDCPLFVFFVFLNYLSIWARRLLILLFISLNIQFSPDFSAISL